MMRDRVKHKIYRTRDAARAELVDYIELFYNAKRQSSTSENLAPVEYDRQYRQRLGVSRKSVAVQTASSCSPSNFSKAFTATMKNISFDFQRSPEWPPGYCPVSNGF